jgi:predicted acyl esterase
MSVSRTRLATAPLLALLAALLFAAVPAVAGAAPTVRPSVEQVQVVGAVPGTSVALYDRRGRRVDRQTVNRLGATLFRNVRPGHGYRLRGGGIPRSPLRVLSQRSTPPSTTGYGQKIPTEGYGYLKARDGTDLAINVHLPAGKGPFPTLVEYAGYGYAREPMGQSSIAQIATLLGFAVVDVNMRGTGCSGGAFDYFEPLQALDGYDVIETVARQPWVAHGKVGMMGISYGGISQLFVGATRPPHLAAIAPLSVIDDTQTTLYPGGVLNTGFALTWAKERVHDALPASKTGGQPWALARIKAGDKRCASNQALHPEAVNLLKKTSDNRYYDPKVADPVAPRTFVNNIDVPTYLACQFTDEQTGGHCPTLAARFTGTSKKWFTFTNGTHIDSLDPATFNRWFDFLSIYVAQKKPELPAGVADAAPTVFAAATGVDGVTLPPDPIQAEPTFAAAKAAFERIPQVRVLFDNGAGRAIGAPYAGFERSFPRWPVPNTVVRSFYLRPGGALGPAPLPKAGRADFVWNPKRVAATSVSGDTGSGGLWKATPTYRWPSRPQGSAVTFTSAPMATNTVILGAGALQAWVKSSSGSPDLQATVTEIRPDGGETFVQSGWLRGNARVLDRRRSTTLAPILSLRRRDAREWPKQGYTKVTVPLYYEGHAYRKGSRIRVTLSAPGGDQPVWSFGTTAPIGGRPTVTVAFSRARPGRLVLPQVTGVGVPTPLPLCAGLRGEPCRPAR